MSIKRICFTLLLSILFPTLILADTSFSYVFGGFEAQSPVKTIRTADGGFLVLGNVLGSPNSFHYNAFVIKVNSSGQLQWRNVIRLDAAWWMEATADGGAVLTFLQKIVKLNSKGEVEWARKLRGPFLFARQLKNGNFIAVGTHKQWIRVTMLHPDGSTHWQKIYRLCERSFGKIALETADGGILIAGRSHCSFDVNRLAVIKIDALGNPQWGKTFSEGSPLLLLGSAARSQGNGFVILGRTSEHAVVLRLNSNGSIVWKLQVEGRGTSVDADKIYRTSDGGIVFRNSFNELTKINKSGSIVWTKQLRGGLRDVLPVDQKYIVSAQTGGSGNDMWVYTLNEQAAPDNASCATSKSVNTQSSDPDLEVLSPEVQVQDLNSLNRLVTPNVFDYKATVRTCP